MTRKNPVASEIRTPDLPLPRRTQAVGEGRRTCATPPSSWQHVHWGSELVSRRRRRNCSQDTRTSTATSSHRLVGLVVKASSSKAEDPGFESRLRRDFFGVESYQWLQNWHSSGYPARRLVLQGQCWDWLAQCQYTVTGWDGKFGLQLLPQCGSTQNCVSRSVPGIH